MMKLLYKPGDHRCGVKRADYAFPEEKCYCFEKDLQGVKTGFWHIMEVCIESIFFTSPWLIPNYYIKNEKKTVSCIDGADLRQDAINCTKRHRRKKKVQHQFISLRYYYDKKIKCTQKTGTNCPLTMSRRGAKYSVQFI